MMREDRQLFFDIKLDDGGIGSADFHIAINVVIDLSAILLECLVSGQVHIKDLHWGESSSNNTNTITIKAKKEDIKLLTNELDLFAKDPLAYDLSALCPKEDMLELATCCHEMSKELKKYA